MKFLNRLNTAKTHKSEGSFHICEFAGMCFAPFSEGFVLAGYSREKHSKFVTMSATAKVYLDAFEPCKENFSIWSEGHSDLFPDVFKSTVMVDEGLKHSLKEVGNFDQAVYHFAKAADAFLFMGYCEGERTTKLYAEDPLSADAISFLQAMVLNKWGVGEEVSQ